MSNALIYSPDFDGHRQVYVFVITNILRELDFKVFIAGNISNTISNSFYIDKLKKSPGVEIIDTCNYAKDGTGITASELLDLQNACSIDLTIFTEADDYLPLFISQTFKRSNRLRGKLVAIFLRPFYFYEPFVLWDKLRYLKHLPKRWNNDDLLFHSLFLRFFPANLVPLYIDENFVEHHKYCRWIPDMFQQYAEAIVKDERSEQRVWIDRLIQFKERNKGRFLVFYFGTAQFRRGYDILLKIAEENGDCFVHCGLRNNQEKYNYDIERLRSALSNNGRLFETNQYIADPLCIEYFFKSVTHLILPYRNFFGSSGVMLQALSYGIPVLAPEKGIIGYRIKKHKLGLTYNGINAESINAQLNIFKELDPKIFEKNIKTYMEYQSTEQLRKILISTFNINVTI